MQAGMSGAPLGQRNFGENSLRMERPIVAAGRAEVPAILMAPEITEAKSGQPIDESRISGRAECGELTDDPAHPARYPGSQTSAAKRNCGQ
ncbi:MAG TPA: hypothetical protein VJ454_10560, partial [Steroidobacteraceae bacterium]|nr:hypothetical protein [Steroidobacteraceae bacterium]